MCAHAYANGDPPARVADDFLADTYDNRALPRTVRLAEVLHRSGLLEERTCSTSGWVLGFCGAASTRSMVPLGSSAWTRAQLCSFLVEADGCESVIDFVMNSPPVAFDFIRYGRITRDRVRSQLLADCHERILSEQVTSRILICVMDRPDGG
jgi:hypothetical protein